MDDSFTIISESKLEDFELSLKKLRAPGSQLLLCSETGKKADVVLLNSKPGQQVLFCVRWLISNPDIVSKHRSDLCSVEDFLAKCSEIIQNKKAKSEGLSFELAHELLQQICQNVRQKIMKQVESAFDEQIEKASSDLKMYISTSVFDAPLEDAKDENKALSGISNYPSYIQELIQFFIVNKVDRKFLLKETLEAHLEEFTLSAHEQDRINQIVKGILNKLFSELLFANKSIKRFNPTTDVTCRNFQIQPLYTYSGNGSLSVCFQVSRPAYFHGFSNYWGQVNTNVEYTISVGEAKNLANVLQVIQTTLKTQANAVIVSERQSASSSAELLDVPILLQENMWYNICMNPRTNGQNFNMFWGTGEDQIGNEIFADTRPDGLEIQLKTGLDESEYNSTYATIFPDFFISSALD